MSGPLRIDLHVHTCYSHDAITTPMEVLACAKKRGLNGIAITDHNTLAGASQLAGNRELIVIPGIEVETSRGHVLALNVASPVPPKLSLSETIQRIHDVDGIAIASHPRDVYRGMRGIERSSSLGFDAIEVVNSAAFPFFLSTYFSRRLAARLNLPQTAGSDSHLPNTIGLAHTLVDSDPEIDEILRAIRKGKITPCGKPVPWKERFRKLGLKLKPKRSCGSMQPFMERDFTTQG